ncbi:family 43 glycosylhydrolase [Mucilaginibacter sp. cycad4]|uniref:family 43 glycosylhydrolase n=1 Tax=Mucilaginibacter sp. cycad4 TaxID=3342096 RepID=UPI002AAADA8B|nr:family 43 glycosylhydrolase [Mucilaginibacter gossypii]WPU98424.1 family 43 glycosylhydrolase [Mucilaginibacter gossypii]
MKLYIKITLYSALAFAAITVNAQKKGDQGNGTYLNPVMSGDFPDPSIMRDGKDYYMVHSAFDYLPGLTVYHSTDLVNWEPVSYALSTYLGPCWAPDITKYKDKYFIYFTIANKGNFVVYADSPNGPWSHPIDLKIGSIDPYHVADETGQRWLFLSGGMRAKLASDGLSVISGSSERVYSGWKFPDEWITEGMALEGPKVQKIGNYYYYINAEGGTAGPATAHMVVVARSKSINGPWENAPNNPLIHTYNEDEKWWNKGHGTLVDAPDGKWWMVYHGYEKNFLNLGRQTLLEPIQITLEGWLKAPTGTGIEKPLAKPVKGPAKDRLANLNDFRIGLDWKYYKKYDPDRAMVQDHALTLKAQGDNPQDSAPLLFVAGAERYEISVKVDRAPGTTAGILLFYNADYYVGTGLNDKDRLRFRKGAIKNRNAYDGNSLWLKLRNYNNTVTGYWSKDGKVWHKEAWGMDITGYNHNTLYDFQSMLPGLFAYGEGKIIFSDLKFTLLD